MLMLLQDEVLQYSLIHLSAFPLERVAAHY